MCESMEKQAFSTTAATSQNMTQVVEQMKYISTLYLIRLVRYTLHMWCPLRPLYKNEYSILGGNVRNQIYRAPVINLSMKRKILIASEANRNMVMCILKWLVIEGLFSFSISFSIDVSSILLGFKLNISIILKNRSTQTIRAIPDCRLNTYRQVCLILYPSAT